MASIVQCLVFMMSLMGISFGLFINQDRKGAYKTIIHKVRNLKTDLDTAELHFSLSKYNSTLQLIKGDLDVKEEIGPLGMKFTFEKWGDGGYKPFVFDRFKMSNLCGNEMNKQLYETFDDLVFTDTCTLKPGKKNQAGLDINTELHKHTQSIWYGKFKINCFAIDNRFDKTVFGYQMEVEFQKI